MGSAFYFFTEPDKLDTQVAAQAFGPAASAAGNDRYRITDTHPLTGLSGGSANAVAVCDGILCAQQDDQGTLTLILRPSQAPPFELPFISYFIYKGIDRSSLLNSSGDQILDENATGATPFTQKIAAEWKKQHQNSLTGSSAALGLDRDANFSHDDANQTKIFTNNDPIDRLFTYPHKTVQLPPVVAGDIIGSFKASAGFEIVLRRLGYAPKLALARHLENYIPVLSLAADNGGTPWQADDAAFFKHWHDKEQILAYMDPCAFFGAFVQAALYKKSAAGTDKVKGNHIYPDILTKFFNRNIAYLDIRNNYSYSYNLFGLYNDTIRFVSHSNANLTNDKNFRAGSWPILRLAIADVPGSQKRSLHRTMLRLPVGQSQAPAVLISRGFVKKLGRTRPKFKAPVIKAGGDGYYEPFRLAFAVADEGGHPAFSSSYSRINLYEKPRSGQPSSSPLDVAGGNYFDGLFRLRDLQLGSNFKNSTLRFEIFAEEVLVDLEQDFGPTYSASIGIAEDAKYVTLFTLPRYFLRNDAESGQPRIIASWANSSGDGPPDFQQWLKSKFPATNIRKATIDAGTANETDVVIANGAQELRAKLFGLGQINDFCIFILAIADHQAMLQQINDDDKLGVNDWPVFSTLSNVATKQHPVANFTYLEATLHATGYQNDNATSKISKCDKSLSKQIFEYADI
jgi:hypothetical protein